MIPSQSSFCLTVSDPGAGKRRSIPGFAGTTVRFADDFLAIKIGQIVKVYGRKATSAV
jgi:hypothetical protein